MPRKKLIIAITAIALMLAVSIGLTLAYIAASSNPVQNTFTIGNVQLTLRETTGEYYHLLPGATLAKDPTLTVIAGSESCWVFFTVEEDARLKEYATYEIADGWYPLSGHPNVYYRSVDTAAVNQSFPLIRDNTVQVSVLVTEEDLALLQQEGMPLKFVGYAIQQIGMDTPHQAWQEFSNEEVTG